MPEIDWWQKPRKIYVVVDNDSWILPAARALVDWCKQEGDNAVLCRTYDEIGEGAAAFYLGCLKITPPDVLARNRRNLVVHASDLPKGRGFSPWTYAILEGKNKIPLCLIEAEQAVDSGAIIYKEWFDLEGTELVSEVRNILAEKITALCQRFLKEKEPPTGKPQEGTPSVYTRRRPADSKIDPEKSIASQFDLLRVVDNQNYPAFFEYRRRRYKLLIEPDERDGA